MATSGPIKVEVDARIKIRVGDHEVDLQELADALTKAGASLHALVDTKE